MQSPRLNPIGPLGRDVLLRPQPRRARRRVRVHVLTRRLRRRARVPPRRAPAIASDPQTAREAGPSSALGTARAPRGQLRVDRRRLRRTRPGAVAAGHSALACASLMAHLRAVLRAGAAGARGDRTARAGPPDREKERDSPLCKEGRGGVSLGRGRLSGSRAALCEPLTISRENEPRALSGQSPSLRKPGGAWGREVRPELRDDFPR